MDAADWLHLADGETVVWESRPHPITMGGGLPAGIFLTLAGLVVFGWATVNTDSRALQLLALLAMLVGGTIATIQYVYWTNTRYVITSSELYKKHGVISRDVTQFRLDRVQNTTLEQSVIGRFLGYGTITVYTAGSGDPELTFERTPRPGEAGGVLNEQLEGAAAAL